MGADRDPTCKCIGIIYSGAFHEGVGAVVRSVKVSHNKKTQLNFYSGRLPLAQNKEKRVKTSVKQSKTSHKRK